MKEDCGNIYQNARKAAGLTQERWAEYLGISVEAVRQYENGTIMPSEEILLRMADISGLKILPYWHLSRKSRIAGRILPELDDQQGLPEAVLGLLIAIEDFHNSGLQQLVRIAADGKVSQDEVPVYEDALDELTQVIRQAYACGYAKE